MGARHVTSVALAIPAAVLCTIFGACSGSEESNPTAPLVDDTSASSEDGFDPGDGFNLDGVPDGPSPPPTTCSDGAPAPSGKLKCPSGANGTEYPKAGAACGPGNGPCVYVQPCGLDQWNCCGTWEKTGPEVPACSLCPATLPSAGSACPKTNLLCAYPKELGKYCEWSEALCKDGTFGVTPKACDPSCPKDTPKTGDLCDPALTDAFCIWAAPCHSQAYGHCTGSKWIVTTPCP
jgi:hypothetical protein